LGGNKVQVGNVVDLFHLGGNGLGQVLVDAAQDASGNASDAVEVFFAVRRVQHAALAVLDGERVATVILKRRRRSVRQRTYQGGNEPYNTHLYCSAIINLIEHTLCLLTVHIHRRIRLGHQLGNSLWFDELGLFLFNGGVTSSSGASA
jgi:hypothetical protein